MSTHQSSFIEAAVDNPGDESNEDESEPQEIFEHGRRYHYFRNGKYPIPNDDLEQNRDDLKHAMVLELTNGVQVHAPIGDNPQTILDLGTGTGIWAIEVGEKYSNARVYGVDLSPIQPALVPPNVKFIIDDVEDDWLATEKYDYIHMRHLMPFLKNAPGLLRGCLENMTPGGWIETCDLSGDAKCDDGTMPADWPLLQFWERMDVALRNMGSEVQIAPRIGEMLEAAGFVNVTRKVYKVPIGLWPANKTLRLVGMYMRQATEDFLGAAAAKPYQTLGMTRDEINSFMGQVQLSLRDRSVHAYSRYFVWTAQKPTA